MRSLSRSVGVAYLSVMLALSGVAWAQKAPVTVSAPASIARGKTGVVRIEVTNTNPMQQTETTPITIAASVQYLDKGVQREARTAGTVNVVRLIGGIGDPWTDPVVTVRIPPPLVVDAGGIYSVGVQNPTVVVDGGDVTLSASSLPAGATWIVTATVLNPE